ncbi:MAG: PfkB family carbohydrate kinase, partial [Verrucomicrobiota bacterium]
MLDVLCAGFACLDLTLRLPHHPAPDEKLAATGLVHSGGGPAANAAVQIARLGGRAGFLGRLGNDPFGQHLLAQFATEGIDTSACVITPEPTPLAVILTKPDGTRNALGNRPPAPPLADPAALLA